MKKYNISCDVVQDLLPLYEDDCCSEQSKKIVEEHLAECETCRKNRGQYQKNLPNIDAAEVIDVKGIKQGIRKISRWKTIGITAVSFVLAIIFVILPVWNYVRGEGLTYTNLKAAYMAHAFEKALVSGNYEKAYSYLDIKSHYNDLLVTDREATLIAASKGEATEKEMADAKAVDAGIQVVEEKGFDWYNEVCKEKFMESMKTLEEEDEMISAFTDFDIERQPSSWIVHYDVTTSSGQEFRFQLDIGVGGIEEMRSMVDLELFDESGKLIEESALTQKALMWDRFYRSPSINETLMELLYGNTDYDWTKLFVY